MKMTTPYSLKSILLGLLAVLFLGMATAHAHQPMGLVPGKYRVVGGVVVVAAVCLDLAADVPSGDNRFGSASGDTVFRVTKRDGTKTETNLNEAISSGAVTVVGNDTVSGVEMRVNNPKPDESYEFEVKGFSVVGSDAEHIRETLGAFSGKQRELINVLNKDLAAIAPIAAKSELGKALAHILQLAVWNVQSNDINSTAELRHFVNYCDEIASEVETYLGGIRDMPKGINFTNPDHIRREFGRELTNDDFKTIDRIFGTSWARQ